MSHKDILELITIFEKSALEVMELKQGELQLYLKKMSFPGNPQTVTVQSVNQPETGNVEISLDENKHEIKSPMVGTFYRASNPEAEPFVKIGDTVKKGDVLCIVEAMKMLNEIHSDVDGIVSEIVVENGTMVDYGKTLFLIEKKDV